MRIISILMMIMLVSIAYADSVRIEPGIKPKPIYPCLSIAVSTNDLSDKFDTKQVGTLIQKYDENGTALFKTRRIYELDADGNSITKEIRVPVLEPKLITIYTAKRGYGNVALSNIIGQIMSTKVSTCLSKVKA